MRSVIERSNRSLIPAHTLRSGCRCGASLVRWQRTEAVARSESFGTGNYRESFLISCWQGRARRSRTLDSFLRALAREQSATRLSGGVRGEDDLSLGPKRKLTFSRVFISLFLVMQAPHAPPSTLGLALALALALAHKTEITATGGRNNSFAQRAKQQLAVHEQ